MSTEPSKPEKAERPAGGTRVSFFSDKPSELHGENPSIASQSIVSRETNVPAPPKSEPRLSFWKHSLATTTNSVVENPINKAQNGEKHPSTLGPTEYDDEDEDYDDEEEKDVEKSTKKVPAPEEQPRKSAFRKSFIPERFTLFKKKDPDIPVPPKPKATFLDMEKRPMWDVKINNFHMLVPGGIFLFCALAIIFGYTNAHAYQKFQVFSSLMTGNFIILLISIQTRNFEHAYFSGAILASHLVFGVIVDIYLLQKYKNRATAFGIIMIFVILACLLEEILDAIYTHKNHYTVCFLAAALGCLAHWALKTSYIVVLLTNNCFKTFEFIVKFIMGYDLGDAKAIGDVFTVVFIVGSYLLGASFSVNVFPADAKLLPIIALCFVLILYECYTQWGIGKMVNCLMMKKKEEEAKPAPAAPKPAGAAGGGAVVRNLN